MKSKHLTRVIVMLTITLLLATVALGRGGQKTKPRNSESTCAQNTKVCLQSVMKQINMVKAYVSHLKPGDPVTFNPQPDPPGEPYRAQAVRAFQNLQREFSELSTSWASDHPKLSPEKSRAGQNAINEAQEKLNQLGQASNRNSANAALNAMKPCIAQLSKVALGPGPPF